MVTLTEFLLARIAEDEKRLDEGLRLYCDDDAHWDDARVLAECKAKRQIVERCDAALAGVEPGSWLALLTLSLLALPYADHPDYDEAWRP